MIDEPGIEVSEEKLKEFDRLTRPKTSLDSVESK